MFHIMSKTMDAMRLIRPGAVLELEAPSAVPNMTLVAARKARCSVHQRRLLDWNQPCRDRVVCILDAYHGRL
jgi:hypothetical protein